METTDEMQQDFRPDFGQNSPGSLQMVIWGYTLHSPSPGGATPVLPGLKYTFVSRTWGVMSASEHFLVHKTGPTCGLHGLSFSK